MHLPDQQSDDIAAVCQRLRAVNQQLFKQLKLPHQSLELPPSEDVFAAANSGPRSVILLIKGQLHCRQGDKSIYFAETGDLLGLHRCYDTPCSRISCDEPVTIALYDCDQLLAAVATTSELLDLWTQQLVLSASFFRLALSQEIRSHYQPPTGFLHFAPGDTMIEQGSDADYVYTLLEGRASAFRDRVKVGDIVPEQIFGAMAVFTRQNRTASVIADTDCTVLAVKKENFIELLENQPRVCMSLIEEMSERIHQLNQQLAKQTADAQSN